ncbi:MAG: tetratricopeptide repeat protein [Calditrichaeota bacterium]|nr:tetratricopeptide repeat protein [Calditrichota bacterium]
MILGDKFRKVLFFLSLCILISALDSQAQGELFQAGWYAEFVEGDLGKAISFYQQIVKDFPDEKAWSAKALLRLGLCYEKLGRNGAIDVYQKIIADLPEEKDIAALAKKRLSLLRGKKSVNDLVKYYFDRTGVDPLSSVSFDRKFLARTDWTSGNLVIEDVETKQVKKLTHTDWSRSSEYGLQPVWSRDGKFIAFSWFRKPSFLELRIISLIDGKIQTIYSDPNLYIYPQDWHPDGRGILCEVYDFNREPANRLALISLKNKKLRELIPASANSRGFMFSPDGKFIAYDLLSEMGRQIMLFSLADSSENRISEINMGKFGFDNPIWNEQGNLLLYRSHRLGKFDLWATPINDGKPAGKSFLVQPDLTQYLLILKEIDNSDFKGGSVEERILNKPKKVAFKEDFSSPTLNPAWSVFSWKRANIYGYKSFGRISLTDHRGHLRYYLTPASEIVRSFGYLPHFSNWYWYYPSLELSRPFWGDRWQLEMKFTTYMPDGANTRIFGFLIFFLTQDGKKLSLNIIRRGGFPQGKSLHVSLNSMSGAIVKNDSCLTKADSAGVAKFSYFFKIRRDNELLQVNLSGDGKYFKHILSAKIPLDYRGCAQLLTLSSQCWFVPAGSYLDWDYVQVKAFNNER